VLAFARDNVLEMSPRAGRSELDAIAAWRTSMLERVLLASFVLLSVTLVFSVVRPHIFRSGIFAVSLLPGWLLVAVALWSKSSLRLRQVALTAGMLTVTVGSVAKVGLQAVNSFCLHLMLIVMVALFMGRIAAWTVWGAGIASWLAIALFVEMPPSPPGTDALFDAHVLLNWLRVIAVYAALSASTLWLVAYFAGRLEKALARSEALYEALTKESTQRISALEEQRALEEQLRQSQKMEALGTLAGGVAHDFNNLLVVIINHAELAALDANSASVRDSLAQIQAAGERAAGLTQRLLTFGRRQVSERAVLDVNVRVEEGVSLLRRLLPTTIALSCQLDADVSHVRSAEVELDQIIMNLCINARDAMPNGGQLRIRTDNVKRRVPGDNDARDFVCLTIEDTGTGMDAATQERIFEPFFTTKKKGQGTGLGLSTVHALVQGSGGFIEVTSEPGQGTSLHVYLPAYAGEEPVKHAPARWAIRPGNETILVADDDAQVREVLARRLRDNGYRVIVCQDGEEALREYRRQPEGIGLVISDAVMPKLGGRELHRLLSSEYGEIPFLICSGYAAQTIEPTFFDHPLRSFLQKPFDDHTLQGRVRELLDAAQEQKSEPAQGFILPGLPKPARS
jgi:signal transduction histidine kinase/ActR/RegA family two-component response regulator